MRTAQLWRKLKRAGFSPVRSTKHIVWEHPSGVRYLTAQSPSHGVGRPSMHELERAIKKARGEV